ncbi:MAG TPA: NAD(P)-dependent oxidoreductase, partial [Micromonosporaceae bacterium]|nr:NAD(P)-dependent oxidoreductase [Micromonosporaceae bacterium]
MRVLVTGARGKVGRATTAALVAAGHEVTATDLQNPDFDTPPPGTPPYVKAELTDAGDAYALIGGASAGEGPRRGPFEAVVHAAALPAPGRHAPHVVFANNLMATFNVVEACVRWQVRRLVNISSETVPGFIFAEQPFLPDYLPVDEAHPARPQDPYALAKLFGEQLCDAAVRRSALRCISLRPSWVQDAGSYARNLGPLLRDRDRPSVTGWSYVDAYDLADAIRLAVGSELPGHEVFYLASPDTIGGRALHESWRAAYPDSSTALRPVDRVDASGISSRKAYELLGWR